MVRRLFPLFVVLLASCLSALPATSAGFKCTTDADCMVGALSCVASVCGASSGAADGGSDAGLPDAGTLDAGGQGDAGAETGLRLAFFRADYPFPLDSFPTREFPSRGRYVSDVATLRAQVQELQYGHVNAGIISWFGRMTPSNADATRVFQVGTSLKWALFYEREPLDTPSAAEIATVLTDARTTFAQSAANYLWLDGGFVFFVAQSRSNVAGCDVATRWVQGNRMSGSRAFLVLATPDDGGAVASCPDQPNAWRSGADAFYGETAEVTTISPGAWPWNGPRVLTRDISAFQGAVSRANDAGISLQYINSFNSWQHGTAVESGHTRLADGGMGTSWASDSGMGAFLDVLHALPFTR
ncbi:MAG: hypothetical protein Q8S33_02075 [Myxococcales bacterium]|nr:hypothetical protein [Myxococcales bacterium]